MAGIAGFSNSMRPVSTIAGSGVSLDLNSLLRVIQMASLQVQTREFGCQTGRVYSSCQMQPSPGNRVTGYIDFAQSVTPTCEPTGNLEIKIDINGLPATGNTVKHGFHIHELGDLSNGCSNTGGHYNPFNGQHGGPTSTIRHYGDLGNVQEDGNGNIRTVLTDTVAILTGTLSINGRSIVIHEKEDDLGTATDTGSTTTGNSGSRLGCCVIGQSDGSRWQGTTRISNLGIQQRPTRIIQAQFRG